MKTICAIFAALLLGMTAAEAGTFYPNPEAQCTGSSVFSLQQTLIKGGATVKVAIDKELIKSFVELLAAKYGTPPFDVSKIVIATVASKADNPLIMITFFGEDECYIGGANVPIEVFRDFFRDASAAGEGMSSFFEELDDRLVLQGVEEWPRIYGGTSASPS